MNNIVVSIIRDCVKIRYRDKWKDKICSCDMARINLMAKIIVDIAVGKNWKFGTFAAIAHNNQGDFIGASVMVLRGTNDPEALRCREAMALASDLALLHVQGPSDCLSIVKAFNGTSLGSYRQIILETKARAAKFAEVNFRHEG